MKNGAALLFVASHLLLLSNVASQDCLQASGTDSKPPFEDENRFPRLPSGTQAIIPSYRFACCANITSWQTYMRPDGDKHIMGTYDVFFQVWRPSPTVQPNNGAGCYSLVGENRFFSINLGGGGLVSQTPEPSNIITARTGDVIGYYTFSRGGNGMPEGIQLDDKNGPSANVWYEIDPLRRQETDCPYQAGQGGILSLSTSLPPVLSVELSTYSVCPTVTSPVVATSTSTLPTVATSTPTFPIVAASTSTLPIVATSTPTFPIVATSTSTLPMVTTSTPIIETSVISELRTTLATDASANISRSSGHIVTIVCVLLALLFMVGVVFTVIVVTVIAIRKRHHEEEPNGVNLSNPIYSIKYFKRKKDPSLKSSSDSKADYYSYAQVRGTASHPSKTATSATNTEECYQEIDTTATKMKPATEVKPAPKPPVPARRGPKIVLPQESKRQQEDDPKAYYSVVGVDEIEGENKYSLIGPEYSSSTMVKNKLYNASTTTEETSFKASGCSVPNQPKGKPGEQYQPETYNKLRFFTEDQLYWAPAATSSELYGQLTSRKYREIPRKNIKISEHLGSGQFGTVSKAIWEVSGESLQLAVKMLLPSASDDDRVKLLQEAAIMGQFYHPNVVKIYGLVTIGKPMMVCLEYMNNGDLKTYLSALDIDSYKNPQGHRDVRNFFLQAARDIAAGMNYFSKKAFVHRDLAARNILLDDFHTCKIGDFGMTRDLVDDTYYTARKGGLIPIKWTAPEALLYKKYSSDSDVWSYGMVLFEIWSLGKRPFPSLTNSKAVDLIKSCICQAPPPGCPRAIYKLMVDCWNPKHHARPTFAKIATYLQQPASKLLHWSPQDHHLSPTVHKLGSAMQGAKDLYPDLQKKYKQ